MITLDISSFFAASAGGIRTYYQAKARHLPATGAECHFVVPGAERSIERFGDGWLHRVPGPPIGAGYRAFGDVGALRRIVRELAPDVVEIASHYLLPQLVAGTSARMVGFYHADVPTTYVAPALARLPRVQRLAVAATWRWIRGQHARYATTLAGSRQIAARLVRHGVPRVRWVGLGVDADVFVPPAARDRRFRIGYAGRLSSDKEIDVVLAAARAIGRSSKARVVIAGDGPRADDVRYLAARGELDYAGVVSASEMPSFLQGLDALVVPGRYESFSLVTAEAMACATPVIAADAGGARELVERSGGGLLFAAGDPHDLATAVTRLYQLNDHDLGELGARGRKHVLAEHTWPQVFARVRDAYQEARCW